ncbi:unnamed protein product, partial [Ectocarpus sp. 12 AP-2014]
LFAGAIPAQLGALNKLEWLDLSNNQLSGRIPPELGKLAALEKLSLGWNQLSGEISVIFQNVFRRRRRQEKLIRLSIFKRTPTAVGGTRSTEIDNSQRAISYCSPRVRINLLRTGSIPKELGDLRELRQLWLNSNRLTGNLS